MREIVFLIAVMLLLACYPELKVEQPSLIPIPQQVEWKDGAYLLDSNVPLSFDTLFAKEAQFLQAMVSESMGFSPVVGSFPKAMIAMTYNE